MKHFIYNGLPSRVIFGAGTKKFLLEEIKTLGLQRVLLVTGSQMADQGAAMAKEIGAVGCFAGAAMHTPVEVTEQALLEARALKIEATVALGGGSAIGLGKAIALRTDTVQICLPTTYAGSEMTPILGETTNGLKTTQRSLKILPEVVIYDPELTLSLPAKFAATSAINAMAHAVEALYAEDANPITSLIAQEAITALAKNLPRLLEQPEQLEARSQVLYGAWLSAVCLATVGMSLHHKLCHTLGGAFNLAHAETHTVILPHAVAFNAAAAPEAMQRLAAALGVKDAVLGLYELIQGLGLAGSLRELGMPEAGIAQATELSLKNAYWNPRQLEHDGIQNLLTRAWHGQAPLGTSHG